MFGEMNTFKFAAGGQQGGQSTKNALKFCEMLLGIGECSIEAVFTHAVITGHKFTRCKSDAIKFFSLIHQRVHTSQY